MVENFHLWEFALFNRPEWYGMLYSQADSKKKSNLMMSLFEPGPEPLPWLGKMAQLGPISGTGHTHSIPPHCVVWVTLAKSQLLNSVHFLFFSQMPKKIHMERMTTRVLSPCNPRTNAVTHRTLPCGLNQVASR